MTRKPAARQQNESLELLPLVDAADKITAFFEGIGGDKSATVSIYAVDPNNRLRRSFLFTMPDVRELTGPDLMAQVLKEYGPGEYMAESRNDQTGQIVFNPRFEVGAIRRGAVTIPGPAAPPAAATPAPRAAAGDISAELMAMMTRQTAALEALARREQPSMVGMLRELKELRDVIAPPPPPQQLDFAKVLELVTGVVQLRDTLGDAGGSDGGPLALLARSLAPALTKIAERAVEAQPAQPAQPALPPAERVTVGEGGDSAEVVDVGMGSQLMLKSYVAELVRFAEQGLEPPAAAKRVLDTLRGFPDAMAAAVVDWLNDEAVVTNLAQIDPRAANYGAWLAQVVDLVLDATLEDETPPGPPAAATNGTTRPASAG